MSLRDAIGTVRGHMAIDLAFGRAVEKAVHDLVVAKAACARNVIKRVLVHARAVVRLIVTVRGLEVLPVRVKGLGRVPFIHVAVGVNHDPTLGSVQ